MTPAALQAAQNSMAARLQQQQQQMPQGGAPRGLPGMLAGMPPNMAMRPHMGGFPNGPNGMPQMPQVRPQQPGMPGQMMPPGMVPPQVGCIHLRTHSSCLATAVRPLCERGTLGMLRRLTEAGLVHGHGQHCVHMRRADSKVLCIDMSAGLQMPPGGLPNLPGLLAAQTAAGPRPSGSST